MSKLELRCSDCGKKDCMTGDVSNSPPFCPSKLDPETLKEARTKLDDPQTQQMARDVAKTWKGMAGKSRIEMTMDYARARGYNRLGLAFCVGLSEEAELLSNALINEGFEVISVCCMCGALSSDDVKLKEEDKFFSGARQPMCNPIGQAALLDKSGCELNIVLGLCVGDDTLFIRHSKAPVTVIAVKDYSLAHNPLGALYTSRSFFSRLNTNRPKKLRELHFLLKIRPYPSRK
jgi:uncharacterized metal-binding protein